AGDVRADVNPVVETPAERVEHAFSRMVAGESGEDRLAHVGAAVAVGVFAVEDFGDRSDEYASVPAGHRHGSVDLFEKRMGGLVDAVVVAIFQQLDRTMPRRVRFRVLVVLRKL